MTQRIRKRPVLALFLACYAVGLAAFLALQLWGFVQNCMAHASGALQPASLALEDFDLYELEVQEDGSLLSVGSDARLVLKDASVRVENVTLQASYSQDPLLVNVFWAKPGQEYSTRRMAYGQQAETGQQFWLPSAGVQGLRIDPGTTVGNVITVHSIQVNQPRALWRFFWPSSGQAFLLCVLPALAASGLWLLAQFVWPKWPARGGKVGEDHG